MFGDDIGSQTFVGPAVAALTKLGVTIAINQAIHLGAASLPDRGRRDAADAS